jgi:hypothetical protein
MDEHDNLQQKLDNLANLGKKIIRIESLYQNPNLPSCNGLIMPDAKVKMFVTFPQQLSDGKIMQCKFFMN